MLIGHVVECVVDKAHGLSGFTKRYRYVLSSSVTKRRGTTHIKSTEKKNKAKKLKQRSRMLI